MERAAQEYEARVFACVDAHVRLVELQWDKWVYDLWKRRDAEARKIQGVGERPPWPEHRADECQDAASELFRRTHGRYFKKIPAVQRLYDTARVFEEKNRAVLEDHIADVNTRAEAALDAFVGDDDDDDYDCGMGRSDDDEMDADYDPGADDCGSTDDDDDISAEEESGEFLHK